MMEESAVLISEETETEEDFCCVDGFICLGDYFMYQ
jgi:hypothetical protein